MDKKQIKVEDLIGYKIAIEDMQSDIEKYCDEQNFPECDRTWLVSRYIWRVRKALQC